MSSSIDTIFRSYEITKDCLRVAQRALNRSLPDIDLSIIQRTVFVGGLYTGFEEDLEQSRTDMSDFAVISMWAAFERQLIEEVRARTVAVSQQRPVEVGARIHDRITHDVEYWPLDDLLDFFKRVIDPALLGHAKQIKDYRDWIAHRNPGKPTPAQTEPATAHAVLSEIARRLVALPR